MATSKRLDIHSALESHVSKVTVKDPRPNILLILTDQQRFDTIRAAGYGHMITPNLDRLAAQGRVYREAYSPNPICCPARHNLLTGLTARHHTIADNDFNARCKHELPTIAGILSDNGYATHAIGKMHFQPSRRHHGFDRFESMEEVPAFIEDDDYLMYLRAHGYKNIQNIHGVRNLLFMSPQQALVNEDHLGSKWVADRALEFLANRSRLRPFFLYLGFIAPHPPLNIPPSMADTYRNAALPDPMKPESKLPPLSEENKAWADFPTAQVERRARECYFTQITYIDEQVGRILDALRDSGQEENTLVVFTSDHGEMLGDLGCYQKFLPYDGSSKIPMLLRYPGCIPAGSSCDDFADLNDILPTFLDVAGLEYPASHTLPGESLLARQGSKNRNLQYIEYSQGNRRWVSIRDPDYEYNYYYGGGLEELFDRKVSRGEAINLLEHEPEKYEEKRIQLRRILLGYEKEFGLQGYIQDDDFMVLDPYIPNPQRNSAFPVFPSTMNGQEKFAFYDEIVRAVANEPDVDLGKLDIESFLRHKNLPQDGLPGFLKFLGR